MNKINTIQYYGFRCHGGLALVKLIIVEIFRLSVGKLRAPIEKQNL